MGTIYAKRGTLYVGYKDVAGKWCYGATEFKVGQEEQARRFLDTVERGVRATLEMGAATLGPVIVNRYAEQWIQDRRDRHVGAPATTKRASLPLPRCSGVGSSAGGKS